MAALQGRGEGFVHPNTPASIHYTGQQKLSLSDVRRRSTRVECVVLPATQLLWRLAGQCYAATEGYTSFASDLEDERAGEGPLLPSLAVNSRKRPRYSRTTGAPTCFFVGRHTTEVAPTSSMPAPDNVSSSVSGTATAAVSGISIVTHHKVSGRGAFIYPDYDGVLSSGVVPEVVASADERREEEERKKYFLTPLDMTPEELEAFEALQGLWQARARSRSAQGAQWRAISDGVQADGSEGGTRSLNAPRHLASSGHAADHGPSMADDEEINVTEPGDREFAETLRLAEELLRFI